MAGHGFVTRTHESESLHGVCRHGLGTDPWAAAGFKDTLLRCEIGGSSWLQDGSQPGIQD